MVKNFFNDQSSDPTQTMTIDIPCGLAARVEKYAEENKTDFSEVIIEALDSFLRGETIPDPNLRHTFPYRSGHGITIAD